MAGPHASFPVCKGFLAALLLFAWANNGARAARGPAGQPPAADPRSCSAAEQESTYLDDYEDVYDGYDDIYDAPEQPLQRPVASQCPADAPTAPPSAPVTLQDQMRGQQLIMHVLSNVTSGTITAEAALELLRGVTALRSSLVNGAAADRWAIMKANSVVRRQMRQKQQAQKIGKQQQQGEAPPPTAATTAPGATASSALNRGILIVAGRSHQFLNAYILLQLLRNPTIGCTLPAEIVYYGSNEYDAKVATAILKHAAATGTSIDIIDGKDVAPPMDLEPHKVITHMTGFKSKVHALTFVTSFDEVLLLDSDNTPMADPTYLFESQSFQTYGNIMWLDFWTNQWMKPVVYSVLGLDVPWEVDPGFRASEAGQLVIDRVQHYDVLEWLWLLNTHSASGVDAQDPGVVGKCLWGDKDTYPLAFHLAGKAELINNIPHHPLQALSRPSKSKFVHAGMGQRGLFGELLFLHRTAAGKLWPHCAMNGGQTCRIAGMTTPVDQKQLVASVSDVTAMEQGVEMVDLEWQEQHCGPEWLSVEAAAGPGTDSKQQKEQQQPTASGGAVGDSGTEGVVPSVHMATMVACDLNSSAGLLPIPVIGVKRLPDQVQKMLKATFEAFVESGSP